MFELGELVLPQVQPNGLSPIPGWFSDPYDSQFDENAINAVSDDDRLDVIFPQHPLSRIRGYLRQVRETSLLGDANPTVNARPTEQSAVRRTLSTGVIRELLWKHKRFDLIESLLVASIRAARADSDDCALAREWLLLGIVQGRQDKLHDSEESLTRAHQMFVAAVGEHGASTATAATHLARVLLDSGKLGEAESLFMRALPVLETNPPNDLVLEMALNGYGRLLMAQDRHHEALPYVQRAQTLAANLGGGQR